MKKRNSLFFAFHKPEHFGYFFLANLIIIYGQRPTNGQIDTIISVFFNTINGITYPKKKEKENHGKKKFFVSSTGCDLFHHGDDDDDEKRIVIKFERPSSI